MSETTLSIGPYVVTQEDSRNWAVTRTTDRVKKDREGNEKTGEFITEHVGYYGDLPACLRSVLRHGFQGQGATDIRKLLARQDEMYAAINRTLEESK